MKKILIIIFGMILLVGLVFSFTQINKTITFDKNTKDTLTLIGITNPTISSCVKIDDFTCKANIYEKSGINKQIAITIKYCEEYNITESNDTFNLAESMGECISWITLNQSEIETEMKLQTEILLQRISDVQNLRNQSKEILTDEILITIK